MSHHHLLQIVLPVAQIGLVTLKADTVDTRDPHETLKTTSKTPLVLGVTIGIVIRPPNWRHEEVLLLSSV